MDEVVEAAELPVVDASKACPTDASVRMGEVRFSYVKEKPILRGVDLDVPEGSMVAIVGPSGCGKTTMLKLIARFYDVDDGAVRIGGVDVRDMTTEDLFARVSFVSRTSISLTTRCETTSLWRTRMLRRSSFARSLTLPG